MPGHTNTWGPEHFINALRNIGHNFSMADSHMLANECEGAARMIWKLWQVAEPEEAAKAKERLFK